MDSRWIKAGYSREDVKRFRTALDALKEILETDFKKKEAVRDYSPGWEYKQIAHNEYNAVLDDILKLVTIEKD
ncbi:hypothetical protein EKK58_08125 [Candidatus Dependentiae bacterium]|nr:MAG: hypothetical protein EKK58_08125 [Candidatus Dependentiae bacterium]